jgi:hypothetical protein
MRHATSMIQTSHAGISINGITNGVQFLIDLAKQGHSSYIHVALLQHYLLHFAFCSIVV